MAPVVRQLTELYRPVPLVQHRPREARIVEEAQALAEALEHAGHSDYEVRSGCCHLILAGSGRFAAEGCALQLGFPSATRAGRPKAHPSLPLCRPIPPPASSPQPSELLVASYDHPTKHFPRRHKYRHRCPHPNGAAGGVHHCAVVVQRMIPFAARGPGVAAAALLPLACACPAGVQKTRHHVLRGLQLAGSTP